MNQYFKFISPKAKEKYRAYGIPLLEIDDAIKDLKDSLIKLELNNNKMKEISANIFKCKKLKILILKNNEINTIPDEIDYLRNLVELDVSFNKINDISKNIKYCLNLNVINLSGNPIYNLTKSVLLIENLQVLILNQTYLKEIPASITSLKNLKVLEARNNDILFLPESLTDLRNLVKIDIGENRIKIFPANVNKLKYLKELFLDHNQIEIIPEEIGMLKNLNNLDLSDNPIKKLPDEICNLESLTKLNVSKCKLECLPDKIGDLKNLNFLKINFNYIESLPESIIYIKKLTEFYSVGNFIEKLPKDMDELVSITLLDFDYNRLTELPDKICGCIKLEIISIRDNRIKYLPKEIGNLQNLLILDICGNNVQFLPYSIYKLKKIEKLWIHKDQYKMDFQLNVEKDRNHGKILTNEFFPQKSERIHRRIKTKEQLEVQESFKIEDKNISLSSEICETEENNRFNETSEFNDCLEDSEIDSKLLTPTEVNLKAAESCYFDRQFVMLATLLFLTIALYTKSFEEKDLTRYFKYESGPMAIKFSADQHLCIDLWSLKHIRKIRAMVIYSYEPDIVQPLYQLTFNNTAEQPRITNLPFHFTFYNLTMCLLSVSQDLDGGKIYVEFIEKGWLWKDVNRTIVVAKFTLDNGEKSDNSNDTDIIGNNTLSSGNIHSTIKSLPLTSKGPLATPLHIFLCACVLLVALANVIGIYVYFYGDKKVEPIEDAVRKEIEA